MITAARLMDDPSRFVHIDGDTIRIGMKTTAFGIDPRDVFGDKRTLARERKKYASSDDLDTRTENRLERQRRAEETTARRSARNPLSSASSMFGEPDAMDTAPGKTSNYDFDNEQYVDPPPEEPRKNRPSDRF
jgi:hypothetical protein